MCPCVHEGVLIVCVNVCECSCSLTPVVVLVVCEQVHMCPCVHEGVHKCVLMCVNVAMLLLML